MKRSVHRFETIARHSRASCPIRTRRDLMFHPFLFLSTLPLCLSLRVMTNHLIHAQQDGLIDWPYKVLLEKQADTHRRNKQTQNTDTDPQKQKPTHALLCAQSKHDLPQSPEHCSPTKSARGTCCCHREVVMLFCPSFTQSVRFFQADQLITRLQRVEHTATCVNVMESDAVFWWAAIFRTPFPPSLSPTHPHFCQSGPWAPETATKMFLTFPNGPS